MSTIPDFMIRKWAENGGIDPFDPAKVNPASIDLSWSGNLRIAHPHGWGRPTFCPTWYLFIPNEMYLLDTWEYIKMPNDWTGLLALKSSLGRQGLEHLHAGYFDPGFEGTATLEIWVRAPWPIPLERGQPIVQLVLQDMVAAPARTYKETGRYCGQRGPTKARERRTQ